MLLFKKDFYESNSKKLDDVFDLKGNQLIIDVENLGIDNCSNELASLRNASEKEVTSLSTYLRYYSAEATNKITKSIKVNQFTLLDENSPKRSFEEVKNYFKSFNDFKNYFNEDAKLKEIVGDELLTELDTLITKILDKINLETDKRFIDFKSITQDGTRDNTRTLVSASLSNRLK